MTEKPPLPIALRLRSLGPSVASFFCKSLSSLSAKLEGLLFRAPFRGVPYAVFLFYILSFALYPDSIFFRFRAADPDDYMRLTEVKSLLEGQGWYDFSIPHLAPGNGTTLFWSRLVDLPIYFFAKLAEIAGTSELRALETAALIGPLLLFGLGLIPLTQKLARPFVGKGRAALAPLFLLALPSSLLFQFFPSRVDHHGWQILFAGTAFANLLLIYLKPRAILPPFLSALSFALALWIGGEIFPILTLYALTLAVLAAFLTEAYRTATQRFGLYLSLLSPLILPLARPISLWKDTSLTWFSSAYVLFALLLGLSLTLGSHLSKKTQRPVLRLSLFLSLFFASAALFLTLIPKAVLGPYADFDLQSASLVLGHVTESLPILETFKNNASPRTVLTLQNAWLFFFMAFLPLTATIASLPSLFRQKGRRRTLIVLPLTFAVPLFLGAFFWEYRLMGFAQIFFVPLLTRTLWLGWEKLAQTPLTRSRFAKEALLFILLIPAPCALIPSALLQQSLYPETLLFPASWGVASACDVMPAVSALPKGKNRILTALNDGPPLLLATQNDVFTAPYNVATNRDAFLFLSARDADSPRAIAQKLNLDFVLVCEAPPDLYTKTKGSLAAIHVGERGTLQRKSGEKAPTLIENLANGTPPSWLDPVPDFSAPHYRLYAVRRE